MGGGAGLDGMLFWEGGMIVDLYNIFLYYYFSFIMEIINKQVSVSHLRWDMKITVLVLLFFFLSNFLRFGGNSVEKFSKLPKVRRRVVAISHASNRTGKR